MRETIYLLDSGAARPDPEDDLFAVPLRCHRVGDGSGQTRGSVKIEKMGNGERDFIFVYCLYFVDEEFLMMFAYVIDSLGAIVGQ